MKGEAIKLDGDHRTWRIIEITPRKLRLIFDSKSQPKFLWVEKSSVYFSSRHWIEWPVYNIHGVARSVRHTAFAPGDLYLDDRDGRSMVRPLSGMEKWNVMELSRAKAAQLDNLGLANEKGQLAGNSITERMAAAVAEAAGDRIARYQTRRTDKEANGFSIMAPDVVIRAPKLSVVFLVVLHLGLQSVVAWGGAAVPGTVGELNQSAAFDTACGWANSLGYRDAKSKCILPERPSEHSLTRAVIYYGNDIGPVGGAELVRIESILGEPLGELAVASLAQVQKMVTLVQVNPVAVDGWQSGRVAGTAAHQVPEAKEATASEVQAFQEVVAQHNKSAKRLKRRLEHKP